MRSFGRAKSQSVTEFTILLAVVLIAALAMNTYVKRGVQGRYADVVDFATNQAQAYNQYEPYYQKEDMEVEQKLEASRVASAGGGVLSESGEVKKGIDEDELTRTGTTTDMANYLEDLAETFK